MAITTDGSALATLEAVQDRVLWLATSIIHHANKVRDTPSGVKVGGHQASSASIVVDHDRALVRTSAAARIGSRSSRTPRRCCTRSSICSASSIAEYLTTLRQFGGLQSYPSRLKDPVPADFSTGSVGIGATAPIWSAIAHRYVAGHFDVPRGGRQVALLGDAELDEGAIWEALVDPVVPHLGEVLWIVDLNRQSLDRIVPDIAAGRIGGDVRGGRLADDHRQVRPLAARAVRARRRRGAAPPDRSDAQRGVPAAAALGPDELRERLPGTGRGSRDVDKLARELDDEEMLRAIRDLGGHDLGDLLDAFAQADAATIGRRVIFAYTIKAWRLATQGHPANHSALLSAEQWTSWPGRPARTAPTHGRCFRKASPEAELCQRAAERLRREPVQLRRGPAAASRARPRPSTAAPRPSRPSAASSSIWRMPRRRSPRTS